MTNFQQMYDKLMRESKELYEKEGNDKYKPIYTWMNHHIIPTCLGTDNKLAKLTYTDHVKAHLLLCLLNPDNFELHSAFHWLYYSKQYKKFKRNKITDPFTLKYIDKVKERYSILDSKRFSGKNHYAYGKKRSKETRQKLSDNHADVSGKNNPMYDNGYLLEGSRNGGAKKWKLISPTNKVYEAHGNIFEICEELNISYNLMRRNMNKKVPNIIQKQWGEKFYERNFNTINWKLKEIK